eukprot:514384-Amorphochlora_amoeboformis.AAC.2
MERYVFDCDSRWVKITQTAPKAIHHVTTNRFFHDNPTSLEYLSWLGALKFDRRGEIEGNGGMCRVPDGGQDVMQSDSQRCK